MGVMDAVEILVFLIWQLLHWLLFGCKNSQNIQKRPGDLFVKGQSGNAAGLTGGSTNRAPWAAEPLLRQIR